MSNTRLAQLLPENLARNLRTGRDLMAARRRAPEQQCLPTDCEPLDHLLQGGVRRGHVTELVSWGSSGRFSMVLGALAATTQSGEAAALIDLGDGLSPSSAAAAGIELDRLLWVRPEHMKQALMATEAVIASGMPLVILDLGVPPIPGGRGIEAFWLRLARSAQKRRSAVLVASPYRVTGTTAQVVVEVKDRQIAWCGQGLQPRLLSRLSNRIQLVRGPGWQRAAVETVSLRSPSSVTENSAYPARAVEEATEEALEKTQAPKPAANLSTPIQPATVKHRKTRQATSPPHDPLMTGNARQRAIA